MILIEEYRSKTKLFLLIETLEHIIVSMETRFKKKSDMYYICLEGEDYLYYHDKDSISLEMYDYFRNFVNSNIPSEDVVPEDILPYFMSLSGDQMRVLNGAWFNESHLVYDSIELSDCNDFYKRCMDFKITVLKSWIKELKAIKL